MKPLVSIIVPIYNRCKLLPRLFRTIETQSYRPIQLILIDNNSTDSSISVCQEYAKVAGEDINVIIKSEAKRGAPAARNKGTKYASGDYIYYFDSDDELSEDFIELGIDELTKSKSDMVCANTMMIMNDGTERPRSFVYTTSVADQILVAMLNTQSTIRTANFVKRIGPWNTDFDIWNDWEYGIRTLMLSPKTCWIKNKTFHRLYQHDESITGKNYTSSCNKIIKALNNAETLIASSEFVGKEKAKRAILYRRAIVAGIFYGEGNHKAAQLCLKSNGSINASPLTKLIAYVLYLYTKAGGRGTWAIARKL